VGDVFEKLPDFACPKLARMTFAVEQNVAPRPGRVALAGFRSPESAECRVTKLIEQPRRWRP
jgi:hypothetical protein